MNSLLERLLMIVVVAILPALVFEACTEIQARQARQQIMQDEALRLLKLVRAEQQRIVEGAQQVLDLIAAAPEVQDGQPDQCQRLLSNLLKTTPRYNRAAVIRPDGTIACEPGSIDPDANASDRSYFKLALQTGHFVLGEYTIGRHSHQPTIHMARPIWNGDGTPSGVIEVALNLEWLNQQLADYKFPSHATILIVDRNGTILARNPDGQNHIGTPIVGETRLILEGNKIGVRPLDGLDGRRRLVAYSPPAADRNGLGISVGLDEKTTFGPLTQENLLGLGLVASSAFVAFILTLWVGTWLIRHPVRRLLDVADRWSSGDLTARTGLLNDRSEFGRLASAFERMAETVQAREHALQGALESTTDAVVAVDRDWNITYLNHRFQQRYGASPVGRSLWQAYPSIIATPFEHAYRTVMQTGQPTRVEGYDAGLDGYFEANVYPSADGLSIFCRDLTEERRAAAALRESENRLQLAREAAGFGVWDRDVVKGTLIWSEQQWRLHGLEPRPGGADMEMWRKCLHPEDHDRIFAARQAALEDPDNPFNEEYRVVWPDGSVHWLQAKTHITRDASGAMVRKVGLTLDITASRETELTLRRMSSELEARVQEEVAAREAAQVRAAHAERMQALGQLAGGIAHDINNVLQAVCGALTLVQRRADNEAAIRRYAQIGLEAIERGASVTRRLLAFGRRGDLRTETVDVADLLNGIFEILTYTLGGAIDVRLGLPARLPPIAADKGQLETVLINLATNARDAMPGGGMLILSAAPDIVGPHDAPPAPELQPGAYVRITVTDNGTGMDEATLVRAREPFFTTKKLGAGTGLGLPMAQGFAQQSGGGLTVESTLGDGTVVALWLPVALREATQFFAEPSPDRPSYDGCARILFVDDEAMIREVLGRHLEDAGYCVLLAAGGAEALAILETEAAIDAVITDLSMPDIDGLTVIKAVQDRDPTIPSILLTGYADHAAALVTGDIASDSVTLLRKPVSDVQLLDVLGAVLATRTVLTH